MKLLLSLCLIGTLLLARAALAQPVVINEIMYHPSSDATNEEYIELLSLTNAPLNLAGWRFVRGVDFTFPPVLLPPRGYLVVAANMSAFLAKYPSATNVVGGWTGALANGGERISLVDAGGTTVNEVRYADGGDWGTRLRGSGADRVLYLTNSGGYAYATVPGHYASGDTVVILGADQPQYNGTFNISRPSPSGFRYAITGTPANPATGTIICRQLTDYGRSGWGWSSRADGLGGSLELVNPGLPNDSGQNWRASTNLHGTPGRANSVAATNGAPLILNAIHAPLVPRSTEPTAVLARMVDEQAGGLTATLRWRVDAASPGTFASAPMADDGENNDGAAGDGIFGALIPPQTNNAVVEWYIEARDAAGNSRTWPAPALDQNFQPIQEANALYQVDDNSANDYAGFQPVYKIIMREAERAELQSYPNTLPNCNARMNATIVMLEGPGPEVRYLAGIRDRGAGTRSAQPANYNVGLPSDQPWNGLDGFNLNTQYTHAQYAGYALSLLSGLDAEWARPLQVRVNNVNRASSGAPQFGSYVQLESTDGEYAANHFPDDPDGNIYRCMTGNHDASLNYLGTNWVSYANVGYIKNNNVGDNDWSDLIRLCDVLSNAPDDGYPAAVSQVANVAEWMRYFAVFTLTLSRETSFANGSGDDYSIYRGAKDPRFLLLAHDFDTILNQGDTPGSFTASLWRMCPQVNGITNYNSQTVVLNRFMLHPHHAPLYFAELKRLADTVFSPAQVRVTLQQTLGSWVPQATIDAMVNFGSNRTAYVLSQIPLRLTVGTDLPRQGGYFFTATPSVTLFGEAPAIDTRSVRVAGSPAAWTAWQARWTNTITLQPGLNRALVQAFDQASKEVARTNLDVWYDDGSVSDQSGTLPGSVVWTPGAGPYLVSGELVVPAGVTLTLQPGTTVYFAAGASLTVRGRLLAAGTPTGRIRFTRPPGSVPLTNTWGGLNFTGTTASNVLAWADLEFAGAVEHTLGLTNSTLYVDNCTFAGTTRTYLECQNASLLVRNSTFENLVGAESPAHLVRGAGLPADGFFILDGNLFGVTTGLNDAIRFSGGQRPGSIAQFLNNVFTGGGDDLLELNGADAHVEGNVFIGARQQVSGGDTANAIAAGSAGGDASEVTIARNRFYNCDHALLAKEGGFLTAVNNTLVGLAQSAVNFSEPGLGTLPGAGAVLDGNIIWNTATNFENLTPPNGTVSLTVNRCILSGADFPAGGTGNSSANPRLANTTNVLWETITNDFRLLPGSPALGAGPNRLDMGGLVPAGASISGEPISPTPQTTAILTIGGPGITHYRYRLNAGAFGTNEIPVATPLQLTGLPGGSNTVSVIGRNSAGVWQSVTNATVSRPWVVNPGLPGVVLNEVLARNVAAVPHGAGYPDLVELYNDGSASVNLAGMGLTDDPATKFKFTFPAGTTLGAGQYLVLYADDPDGSPGLHLGFALNAEGEAVYLYHSNGTLLDSIQFGLQLPDLSIGRLPTGGWGLTQPTFGTNNVPATTGPVTRLRINEWLATAESLFPSDFVELYNPDPLPVALGGLYLSDLPVRLPAKHRMPPLSFIAGYGFTVLYADGDTNAGANHLNFRLAAERGSIALYTADLTLIDQIVYGPQRTDVSEGRRPNGADTVAAFEPPTPGGPNPGPPTSFCTVTDLTAHLMPYSATWRYNETESMDGNPNWKSPAFNDSAWPVGEGLLAFEDSGAIVPLIRTVLADPRTPAPGLQAPRTYYFRTYFRPTNDLSALQLTARIRVDDGAVIYLNGTELARLRMPSGPITYGTLANQNPGDAVSDVLVTFPGSLLLPGTNVIAAEVHQVGATSSDIVWGLALDGPPQFLTNCVQLGVVLNEVMASNLSVSNTDGTVTDWVELYNPSTNTLDLSDMSLSDDINRPRRWVFPAGVAMPPGTYRLVRCDGTNAPSTNAGPVLNTGFGLRAESDEVYLFDALSKGGSLLDSVAFGIQTPDFSIGRVPNGGGAWRLALPTPAAANIAASLGDYRALRLNEWMAAPDSGEDWFELYNPNAQPVDLGGLYLTDNLTPAGRNKYRIPALSFIGAGQHGYIRFWADGNTDPARGADHVNFRLDADGEFLGVYFSAGIAIDTLAFGPQERGVSEGRFPDGSTNIARFPGTATPGEANLLPLREVVVNEVLTHTDPPFEDAIELHNVSAGSVDLSGWYLTDNQTRPRKFRIPEGTVIESGGFTVFYEYQFNPDFSGQFPYFALDSTRGDEVYLLPADAEGNLLGYRAGARFGAAETAVSMGRHLTSIGADFTALSQRTFGADSPATVPEFRTGAGRANAHPKVGPVVLHEIMYHPTPLGTNENFADEFLELRNVAATNVPLYHPGYPTNTWRLRDAVDFNFPPGTNLPPGGYLLVVSFNPATNAAALAAFRSKFSVPAGVPVLGPWQGRLANDNDNVELYRPDDPEPPDAAEPGYVPYVLVDKVRYADTAPWPSAADGSTNAPGVSLQRRVASDYGNDPVNWLAGAPTAGAANGGAVITPPTITSFTPSQTVAPGASVTLTATVTGTAPFNAQWRFNGVVIAGATGNTLVLANVRATNAGRYTFTVSNPGGAASASTRLDVAQPPVITKHPESTVAALGGSTALTVAALGATPLSYQWQKGGTDLPGATRAALAFANVQPSDAGLYRVILTNAYGATTSQWAVLTLNAAPQIVVQPEDVEAEVGTPASFSALAGGAPPLRYQWRFEGAIIPGATNAILTLPSVQFANAGRYTVVVTNLIGTDVSPPATLMVTPRPLVSVEATDPWASEPGANTGTFTFSRSGSLRRPLTANFTVGGSAVPGSDYAPLPTSVTFAAGAAVTNLVVTALDDALLEGNESVVVTLLAGPAYDLGWPSSATVFIVDDDNLPPAVALTSPADGAVFTPPVNVSLSAVASDPDGSVVRVEFFANGTNRLGQATAAPYTIVWVNPPYGQYRLTALATDNLGGASESAPVHVTINSPPFVSLQEPPNGALFVAPADITLRAVASDPDGTIASVDFYSGTNFLGTALTAPYTFLLTSVSAGGYQFTARAFDNHGASALSAAAGVTVQPPTATFTDFFADRGTLFGFTNLVVGDNTTYTREPREPAHAGKGGTHSAWISWLAPASGPCAMSTVTNGLVGASNLFDTVLAVYTGTNITNLTFVASNDDATNLGPNVVQSQLTFTAAAGVTYQIAVDGYDAAEFGRIYFRLGLPDPYPRITNQPQSQVVNAGANVTFVVGATGPAPLRYRWQFNGTNLANATNATLALVNVRSTHAGVYTVIVTNLSGAVTSAPALLTVRVPPAFTVHPRDQVADPGSLVYLVVSATGTAPLAYQWRLNGTNLPWGTNRVLTFPNVQHTDGGSYVAVAANEAGSAQSQAATLTVRPQFTTARMLTNRVLELNYNGTPASTYLVEGSTDLASWSLLGSSTNSVVPAQFRDTNAAAHPQRAYRLKLGP